MADKFQIGHTVRLKRIPQFEMHVIGHSDGQTTCAFLDWSGIRQTASFSEEVLEAIPPMVVSHSKLDDEEFFDKPETSSSFGKAEGYSAQAN